MRCICYIRCVVDSSRSRNKLRDINLIKKTLKYVSAPRKLQLVHRNAEWGATWRSYYESCLQGIYAKQINVKNIYESKTQQVITIISSLYDHVQIT